jgi:hypothetical protein
MLVHEAQLLARAYIQQCRQDPHPLRAAAFRKVAKHVLNKLIVAALTAAPARSSMRWPRRCGGSRRWWGRPGKLLVEVGGRRAHARCWRASWALLGHFGHMSVELELIFERAPPASGEAERFRIRRHVRNTQFGFLLSHGVENSGTRRRSLPQFEIPNFHPNLS